MIVLCGDILAGVFIFFETKGDNAQQVVVVHIMMFPFIFDIILNDGFIDGFVTGDEFIEIGVWVAESVTFFYHFRKGFSGVHAIRIDFCNFFWGDGPVFGGGVCRGHCKTMIGIVFVEDGVAGLYKYVWIIFDEFHTPGMEGLSFESFKGARGASCTNARDDFHSRFARKGKHDDAVRRGSILYKVLCPGDEGARFPRPGSGQDEQVFSCERDSGALLCIQFFLKMVCAELVGGIFGFVCDFCIRHRGPRGKDVRPNVRPDAFERIII